MEFDIALGLAGWALVIVVAVAFGGIAQFIGETRTSYEWVVDGVAFGIGAIVASEFLVAWRTAEPVWDGLALVPALVGGLVVGLVVEVLTRFMTGGNYSDRPIAA